MGADDRIIVFTRYPVPGKSKTRLIPALGRTGAADLHRRFTEETLRKVRAFAAGRPVEVEVCFDGGSDGKIRRWLGPGLILRPQRGVDLGARMKAAFDDAFREGSRRVVLHGTDIPEISAPHLKEAFDALDRQDLVLGPSTDGGYWLIGLRTTARLFDDMPWGGQTVLEETLARARGQGLGTHLLKPLTDIDTVDALQANLPGREVRRPYLSVIIPVLDEGGRIESTVRRALNEDTEIIVVDGGSRDDTVSKATKAGARVLPCPRGRALQQNLGADEARGDVLLFLHADTILPAGYVRHVFETLMDRRAAAGAFRFRSDLRHPVMGWIERLVNFRARFLRLPYGDQALFLRRATFQRAGGFPEVPIAEDLLLVRRLASFGRVEMADAEVITSGRRWRELGLLRTTLLNQVVLAGLLLGIPPRTLARLYRGT